MVVTKIINNNVNIYIDYYYSKADNELNGMHKEVDPVTILQNDDFECNNKINQTVAVTKIINNNVKVYRNSNAPMADLHIERILYKSSTDDNYKTLVDVFENDEFDMDNSKDDSGVITKEINNNVKIYLNSNYK